MIKTGIFLPIMILATAVSVWLHSRRLNTEVTDRARVEVGLKGIDAFLQPGQPLSLYSVGVPSEVFLYARYALAPRHLVIGSPSHLADTMLLVTAPGSTDTTFSGKKILWEHSDSPFQFDLIKLK